MERDKDMAYTIIVTELSMKGNGIAVYRMAKAHYIVLIIIIIIIIIMIIIIIIIIIIM